VDGVGLFLTPSCTFFLQASAAAHCQAGWWGTRSCSLSRQNSPCLETRLGCFQVELRRLPEQLLRGDGRVAYPAPSGAGEENRTCEADPSSL